MMQDGPDIAFVNGQMHLRHDSNRTVMLRDLVQANGEAQIEAETTAKPDALKQAQYSVHAHNDTFVDVKVDEDLGTIHVTRVVNAVAAGHIINPKTNRSQVLGSVE